MRTFSILSVSMLALSLFCVHSNAAPGRLVEPIGDRLLSCNDNNFNNYKLEFSKEGNRVRMNISTRAAVVIARNLGVQIPADALYDQVEITGQVVNRPPLSTCNGVTGSYILNCAFERATVRISDTVTGQTTELENVEIGLNGREVHTQEVVLTTFSESDRAVFTLNLATNARRINERRATTDLSFLPSECQ